jgi:Synergist-CTERM protein sorting domain-containing protein
LTDTGITIAVGSQSGTITAGSAGSATFVVTTTNLGTGFAISFASAPAWASISGTPNVAASSTTSVVVNATSAATSGTHQLRLKFDDTTDVYYSVPFNLVVSAAPGSPSTPGGGGSSSGPSANGKIPTYVTDSGTITSITIVGNTLTINFSSGQPRVINLLTHQARIVLEENKWDVAAANTGHSIIATAFGQLIPTGHMFTVMATPAAGSGRGAAGDPVTLAATSSVVDGNTVITIPYAESQLPPGIYDITYATSDPTSALYYSGVLVSGYEVKGSDSTGTPNTPETPAAPENPATPTTPENGGSSGGGGCDAGFGAMVLLAAAGAAVLRKK